MDNESKTPKAQGTIYILLGLLVFLSGIFSLSDGQILNRLSTLSIETTPFLFILRVLFSVFIGSLCIVIGLAKMLAKSK
jgi:hypothetical protein